MSRIINAMCNDTNQHQNVDNLLDIYLKMVLDGNRKLNLVSRRDAKSLLERLIEESLFPLDWNVCHLDSPLIDIGSGAGIPGIPLKIKKPQIEAVLLEANRRKSLFIRNVVSRLNLDGVEVLCERAENICRDDRYRNRFSTLVSRGVASLDSLLGWGCELLRTGGELIAWKGSSFEDECGRLDTSKWTGPDKQLYPGGLVLVRFVKKKA